MATNFSGGRSRSTRSEPPTMGKQLVNFITQLGSYQELCLSFPKYICDSYDVVFVFASDVFLQLKMQRV
jgi:hypothetical protein